MRAFGSCGRTTAPKRRLARLGLQIELRQALGHLREESSRIGLLLEAGDVSSHPGEPPPEVLTEPDVNVAAHLTDHVLPRVPVRQWVLSVPKRLRYHLQHDREALKSISRIKHLFAGCCPRLTDADTCLQRSLPRTDRR